MSETPPPPPPPPPSGGAPPPPPPAGGYGGPPPPGQPAGQYNVGEAVSYGWAKFQANAAQIIIAGLVVFVGIVVFEIIGYVIRNILVQEPECTGSFAADNFKCTDGSGFFITLLASAIMAFLFYVVFQIIGAGIIRGSLHITDGKPFVVSEIFKTDKIGPIIITSLISSAIILVGFILCFLPGIIAAFFLQYALYFVIDRDQAPMEAITSSFTFVKDNLANTVIWYLVSLVITVIGAILCGIGLIVAIPVSLIGTAYTYKKLTGQAVAA